MTRTEFIKEIRAMADALEQGSYYIIDIGNNKIFANRNYGQVWVRVNKDCEISVDLFSATDEEKEAFED